MQRFISLVASVLLLAACATRSPSSPPLPQIADYQQARALSADALALMNQGDDAGAIALLDRVIAYNGGEVEDFTRRATANASLNRHQAALQDLETAITRDPKRWRSYLLRAVTYQKIGRYDAAIADLTTARNLQPSEVELLRRRAYLEIVSEHFDAAAADYRQLTEMLPKSSTGPFGQAVALYLAGDWPAATDAFARQAQAAPRDGIVALWMVKSSLRSEAFIAWDQLVSRAGPEPEWLMIRALLSNDDQADVIREIAALRTPAPNRRTVGACEQALFLGTWAQIRGRAESVRFQFESARVSCPADSIEGAEARTELARAQRANK